VFAFPLLPTGPSTTEFAAVDAIPSNKSLQGRHFDNPRIPCSQMVTGIFAPTFRKAFVIFIVRGDEMIIYNDINCYPGNTLRR